MAVLDSPRSAIVDRNVIDLDDDLLAALIYSGDDPRLLAARAAILKDADVRATALVGPPTALEQLTDDDVEALLTHG